ncbi:peptidoglycan bridge formation glycyltransferase FemA/FemB family protein [Candidatus Shapirobacteria bacterium]|nr:peptidoglycan bridge formation glycyltransferase FemA/FemB family protein [Candidatus Shapirobacteria bacterium]
MSTDLRQSPEYACHLEDLGWKVELIDNCHVFIRRFPLLGSILKIQRPNKIPSLDKVETLARKYHAYKVSLEPQRPFSHLAIKRLKNRGYQPSRSSYLPTKTVQIDLRSPLTKILKNCQKDCRYCLKKTSKKPLQLTEVADPKLFQRIWRKSLPFHKWLLVPSLKNLISLKKNFGKHCYLLLSFYKEIPLGGTIILISGKTAYYFYAFTNQGGRKLLAQYFLVWEAIRLAKRKGCFFFDFEGIYDERFPLKSWQGFSHFKKSFGGKEISYPPPLAKTRLFRLFG